MSRLPPSLVALAGGSCLAASLPPWGWWPLAFVGVVLLERATDGHSTRRRFRQAWLVGLALYLPSLWWMRSLTAPGYLIASLFYAALLAVGVTMAPKGRGRYVAIPAALMLTEWVRWRWPFGGVPLSNLAVGQVAGPLAPVLRVGGALLLVGVTVLIGMGLAALVRRETKAAVLSLAAPVVAVVVAFVAPQGSGTGDFVDVALVQGGGPQGTRAEDTAPGVVMERHLLATAVVDRDVDLLLWPEDVVDIGTLAGSDTEAALQAVAVEHDAVFIAGVIEDDGREHFRNWAVVYDADGDEIDRYEKVERVPFGEWVPMRDVLSKVAGDALPDRDARIGRTPAVVDTPKGRLAVSISWEIFFGERAREGVNHGGQLLVNPTNGASFSGTQVQTQQVANSRMRAIENGRWVTQIAPTGFSAVVSPDGDVLQRTAVSEQRILYDTVELRTGRTIYTRTGDLLAIAVAVALLAAGWIVDRRRVTEPAPPEAPSPDPR